MKPRWRPGSIGVVAIVLLLIGTTASAGDPAVTCKATKMARAGAYNSCLLKTAAKALRYGGTADTAKCDAKFAAAWTKAEANGGGACPTTGDGTTIRDQVQADVADIIAALMPSTTTTTTTTATTTTTGTTIPCGGATYPGCGGSCPPGLSCWANTSAGPTVACICLDAVATPCADTDGSAGAGASCGGACPAGEVCSVIYIDEATFHTTCGCMPEGSPACLTFGTPGSATCDGGCPSGMICGEDPAGLFACACQ
jgi:hypothetical protein